ncbi:hypothetical protein ACI48D_20495 [Massilia sp. LXY-6]|uniref:hypothetical protein n=1 Tax=Massilia sp. LXY-6 TaxID=3379823 RepID=UPI003EE251E3
MSGSSDTTVQFTLTDIEVGSRLVEALVQHARSAGGASIAHEDLLTLGRNMYPKDVTLGREVAVGIGVKLLFVEAFCQANDLPKLACLAVNGASMRPRPGYKGDWEAERHAVAGFDWSGVNALLAAYAGQARAAVPKRFKPRKERPADVAWYAYYCSHRPACAQVTAEDKKEIVNLLMAGLDPESALRRVLAAKAELAEIS